jgi:hypothetical protein
LEMAAPASTQAELIVGPRFTGVDQGENAGTANGFAVMKGKSENPIAAQAIIIRDFIVILHLFFSRAVDPPHS